MNQGLGERRIVVGVHGSAASLAALRWAAWEAGLLAAQLHVVRAWEHAASRVAPYAPHASLPDRDEDQKVARAGLEHALEAVLGPASTVPVTAEVAEGLAARVLLERAAGADLLVLGSVALPARDGIGPAAQACLRRASCPVVIVSAEMAQSIQPARPTV